MKDTFFWIFWPLKKGASWRDRLRMAGLFVLLMSGMLSIGILSWWLEGR